MHRAYAAFIRLVALAVLLASSLSTSASAQSAEHEAAYRVVTRLFDSMRARDTAAMRAAFVSNASTQTLTRDSVRFETIDGWLTSIARAPAGLLLDERIANPVIKIDGDLASIWVDYWFFADDRFSHCGVDAFLLARHAGEWKVFGLVDTRRTQGCAPAPSRRPS